MRQSGYSLLGISATSLLFVPWALKFLWAPYVDRHGTRRGWLLPLQLATALGAALLAMLDLSRSEEPTSELQSLMRDSYLVFCSKKKTTTQQDHTHIN